MVYLSILIAISRFRESELNNLEANKDTDTYYDLAEADLRMVEREIYEIYFIQSQYASPFSLPTLVHLAAVSCALPAILCHHVKITVNVRYQTQGSVQSNRCQLTIHTLCVGALGEKF